MNQRVRSLTWLLLLLATACVDTPRMAEPDVDQSRVELKEFPEASLAKLDILIVLDDTLAMSAYQERIAGLPGRVASMVTAFGQGWADVRIAVAASDGTLRRVPATDSAYLVDARTYDFTHRKNYGGRLDATLAAMMNVGAARDGASEPLDAMRRVLEANGEFVRDDAALAILLVSATDDASPFPVADYAAWTLRLTRGSWSRRLAVAGFVPAGAPRLDDYIKSLQGLGYTQSIDEGDPVKLVGSLFPERWGGWGSPCLDSTPMQLADADHYDCVMTAIVEGEPRSVPQCEARAVARTERLDEPTALPPTSACWSLVAEPQNCTLDDHLTLALSGYTLSHHPAFRFECRTH